MYPVEGSMDISFDLDKLSVDISDPDGDSFDWIISTNPDIGSNQSSADIYGKKFCDVNGLLMDTEYNWTVTAVDKRGAESNFKFNFKTEENIAPLPPSVISPKNRADEVKVEDVVLEWSCVDQNKGDSLSYDVYFDKTNNPKLFEKNINQSYFKIDDYLDLETTYYWKIIATDKFGETSESEIWSFTTSPVPPGPKPGDVEIDFSKKLCCAGVKVDVIHSGDRDVSDIFCHISISGGTLDMVNISKGGCIDRLNIGETQLISTRSLLDFKSKLIGFGNVVINVKTTNQDGEIVCTKSCDGLILGFLLLIPN